MQPTDYGLGQILTSPLVLAGLALILGGSGALVWMFRGQLGYYEPEIPPVVQPLIEDTFIRPAQPVAPNYHRSGEYPVVPRIPGATPEARPPVVEERSDETVEIPFATEPAPSPIKPLAQEFVALSRFFSAVDEARADTDQAMRRLAAHARPDCPLTTQEIEVTETAPLYVASGGTVDLSEKLKKVSAP